MGKKSKKSNTLINPRYCCCAIPMVNAGIYAVIAEQTAVGITTAVLCFAAPKVPGAGTPSFVAYILAIICLIGVALQPVGFIGVFREKTKTFRIYTALNGLVTLLALIVSLVVIIVSAVRHNYVMQKCEATWFEAKSDSSIKNVDDILNKAPDILCKAFAWADIGFMGGLWVLLFISQTYFAIKARRYGKAQVKDHKLYHSVYSENPEAFTMSILQSKRYNGTDSVYWNHGGAGPGAPGATRDAAGPHVTPGAPGGDAWDVRPSYDYDAATREPGTDAGVNYYHPSGYAEPHAAEEGSYAGVGAGAGAGHDHMGHMGHTGHMDHIDHMGQHQNQYAFNEPGPGYVDSAQPHDHQHRY